MLVVGRGTAHFFRRLYVAHRVLSAMAVVARGSSVAWRCVVGTTGAPVVLVVLSAMTVVARGSSVAWRYVVGTTGAPVVLVVIPRLAPGVSLSVVGCVTGIIVVFGDPGLPLYHSRVSTEKVANLFLTSDLS